MATKPKPNADKRFHKKGVDKEKVLELHKAGMRNSAIAREMGCSASRVTGILKEAHEKLSKPPLDTGKIGALYRAGWSVTMIAFEMCCDEEEVCSVLRVS